MAFQDLLNFGAHFLELPLALSVGGFLELAGDFERQLTLGRFGAGAELPAVGVREAGFPELGVL